MKMMLGRRLNHLTMCWEAVGLTPIPAEAMDAVQQPGATLADLLCVLAVRDKIAAQKVAA